MNNSRYSVLFVEVHQGRDFSGAKRRPLFHHLISSKCFVLKAELFLMKGNSAFFQCTKLSNTSLFI